jgi:hypothetical protein
MTPGKTPYEMLNKSQPTLAHLRVFGARCFARIPMELQEKLGPHSHEAIFMGYPPGVKAWHCRDTATGVFFNSRDVVFDEAFTNHPFPDSDDDEDDKYPTVHRAPAPASTPTPIMPTPAVSAPPQQSSHIPVLTEKGQVFKSQLLSDQAWLARQREIWTAKIQGVPPPPHQTDNRSNTSLTRAATGPVGFASASTSPVESEELTPDNKEIGFP